MSRYPNEDVARFDQQFRETEEERNDRLRQRRGNGVYSTMPVPNEVSTLPSKLRARADEIDNRLGPIPGRVADLIARELREAAAEIERSWQIP